MSGVKSFFKNCTKKPYFLWFTQYVGAIIKLAKDIFRGPFSNYFEKNNFFTDKEKHCSSGHTVHRSLECFFARNAGIQPNVDEIRERALYFPGIGPHKRMAKLERSSCRRSF